MQASQSLLGSRNSLSGYELFKISKDLDSTRYLYMPLINTKESIDVIIIHNNKENISRKRNFSGTLVFLSFNHLIDCCLKTDKGNFKYNIKIGTYICFAFLLDNTFHKPKCIKQTHHRSLS